MSEHYNFGIILSKIEFWTSQYEFAFHFLGDGNNSAYITRGDIELWDMGGVDTIHELLSDVLEWCEKANPSKKYPAVLTITNPQP